jgi:hypothetical protein
MHVYVRFAVGRLGITVKCLRRRHIGIAGYRRIMNRRKKFAFVADKPFALQRFKLFEH